MGNLPSEVITLIRPHTGDVIDVRPAHGHSSARTALVECDKETFFVKAVPNRPGGRRDSLVREELINPFVQPVCPALRWRAEDDAWYALGFAAIAGRAVDFTPESPDLPAVVEVLNRIGDLDLPDVARDWPETRWDRFAADETDAALFQGETLLFTDLNPDNLVIGEHRVWAVDWSWPTRGAAFIDPACLVMQLVAAGHSARSAESWAARCPGWTKANPKAIDAFAAASLRMNERFAERYPDTSWLQAMATAAQNWVKHRASTPST